jgi:hypothetical protein
MTLGHLSADSRASRLSRTNSRGRADPRGGWVLLAGLEAGYKKLIIARMRQSRSISCLIRQVRQPSCRSSQLSFLAACLRRIEVEPHLADWNFLPAGEVEVSAAPVF